ncbi:alpha/beta fold hydrolase [Seongchinamella sediminis]|nr:alpha/beta fold hydrolase [Seongchinamella sediminis]
MVQLLWYNPAMKTHYIDTADGAAVPLYWLHQAPARATLLLQPALGIQARLYHRLAQGLAERGIATALVEQRGHGLSSLRPGYRSNYSFRETLDCDIPAVAQWLQQTLPGVPRYIGGHSLGGHLSTIYTGMHPNAFQGVVHLACAFPYAGDYRGRTRHMLRLLTALIPLFHVAPGYYPGQLLGFGERESLAMMMQWRQWALSGQFDFSERRGLADAVARFRGEVLSLSFARDPFSTDAAVDRALSPFTGARIQRATLDTDEQGEFLGHTAWAKQPEGVVRRISEWLDSQPR